MAGKEYKMELLKMIRPLMKEYGISSSYTRPMKTRLKEISGPEYVKYRFLTKKYVNILIKKSKTVTIY